MKFRGIVERSGKTATGIPVPADVRRPRLRQAPEGPRDYQRLRLSEQRGLDGRPVHAAGQRADPRGGEDRRGDDVEVDVVLDTEPREVSVPADLAAALDGEPSARDTFGRLPYSHQLRYVTVIEDAKTPETRQRRIDKTISALRGG